VVGFRTLDLKGENRTSPVGSTVSTVGDLYRRGLLATVVRRDNKHEAEDRLFSHCVVVET
jgi:hypothetical protein